VEGRVRVILLLLSVVACGLSFPSLFWKRSKRNHLTNFFGVDDPRLQVEWDRLWDNFSFHNLKNIAVEWNRLESQRGVKTFGAIILILLVL
jgi:hypothetical protein